MISKKKPAKKTPPAKRASKPAKQQPKKATKKPATKKGAKSMTDTQTTIAQPPSAVETLLADIAAKLGELVQIETYLANKVAQQPAPIAAPVTTVAANTLPAVATVSAAPAQPSTPPSRPGEGTIGGLVWGCCDGLAKQLGRAPTKEEVVSAIKTYKPETNELTLATQYSKWRAAQGLPRLPRGFGASKPAAVPATQPAAPVPPVAAPAAPSLPPPVAQPAPIPAVAVPSVIAPTAAPPLPPWLRAQG